MRRNKLRRLQSQVDQVCNLCKRRTFVISSVTLLPAFFLPFFPVAKDDHSSSTGAGSGSSAFGSSLTGSMSVPFLPFFLGLALPHPPPQPSSSATRVSSMIGTGSSLTSSLTSSSSWKAKTPFFFFLSFLLEVEVNPKSKESSAFVSGIGSGSGSSSSAPKENPVLFFFFFGLPLSKLQGLLSPPASLVWLSIEDSVVVLDPNSQVFLHYGSAWDTLIHNIARLQVCCAIFACFCCSTRMQSRY